MNHLQEDSRILSNSL